MLARKGMPDHFEAWNDRWGAPNGRGKRVAALLPGDGESLLARWPRLVGPFAFQVNNVTRRFEYPWAYFAIAPRPGMRALEIGGGLSGLQFVLAMEGVDVTNVDPGQESAGVGWPVDQAAMARLNRAFGTDVTLISDTLQGAGLPDAAYDVVYSISTIEHVAPEELPTLMKEVARVLKPGGRCVLTVDLFLNLAPFSDRRENTFGVNADLAALCEWSGLELVTGERAELCGFPEFSPRAVLADLESMLVGTYPSLAQCLVLSRPAAGDGPVHDGP